MRLAWKYLILFGGIAGIAGFFLPFVTFRSTDGQLTGAISAFQIVGGIDDVTQLMEGAKPVAMTNAEVREFVSKFDKDLATYRGYLVAFYVPAAAMALFGAIAGIRSKMGRIAGLIAILLGLANAALWMLVYQVSMQSTDTTIAMGFGMHLLLIAGVLGTIAGVGALFAPDHGDFT